MRTNYKVFMRCPTKYRNLIAILTIFIFTLFTFSPIAVAYPQESLKECILGSKQNPIIIGVPEESIKNYCDCALKLIVDEKKEVIESANHCGSIYFR